MVIYDEMAVSLNKEIDKLTKVLVSGQASDYAFYREIVGRIEGIESAKQILHDILKARFHNDEDD